MGFIPFTDEPVEYRDPETDVVYVMRQPTDEVEIALIDIKNRYTEKIGAHDELGIRQFINESVDAILLGWKHDTLKIPAFPDDGKPSRKMPTALKMALLARWKECGNFTKDELKK